MRHQIGSHQRDALQITLEHLQRGPLRLRLFPLRQLIAFGDFPSSAPLWQRGGVRGELGSNGAKWGD